MDIRKTFLDYFKGQGHVIMPSSSLIPKNDPSVLLTTAGMQQFKPYYLGTETPPAPRIATVQKCFRTSDIDSVGYTDRHLTFFEMLGNFSFGDYFKKESIRFAVDFCVNILRLPKAKLLTAVFSGDDDIPADEESIQYWIDNGIDRDRIYRFGKEENFWGPAGSTGPCGPCTEIYYDFGPHAGCGRKDCSPECECGRYLEVWNLVFTQYNFDGKSYAELPKKNIDTGMGLERIMSVLEGQYSVFKTSLFKPVLDRIYDITGKRLMDSNGKGTDEETNRAIRILADHSRAAYFLLADGVTPSNEGRGYILRRIIRRAVRFGKKLGIDHYFLNQIGEQVIKFYSKYYEELSRNKHASYDIVMDEEKRFTRTLNEGSIILGEMIEASKKKGMGQLDPMDAFRLYETYGFPVELTTEILKEKGMGLDLRQFREHFDEHIRRSRKKTSFDKKVDRNIPLYKRASKGLKTEFLGYEKEAGTTTVKGIIKTDGKGEAEEVEILEAGEKGELILQSTVFYGEKGGQTGDEGIIKADGGIFIVSDTVIPLEDVFIHRGFVKEGRIRPGDRVEIEIDHIKRWDIRKNHTSTHLLHWALRHALGEQVKQSGSFVAQNRLRFDYSVFKALDRQQIRNIEKMVNEKIQRDDPVRCFETTMEYARELDAVALFDEKYGKFVRVVEIDDYNRELCGGTHVKRTGEIGLFKIISDSSIGANLRRIEAVTGMHAYDLVTGKEALLKDISDVLEVEEDRAGEAVKELKDKNQKMAVELEDLKKGTVTEVLFKHLKDIKPENGKNIVSFDLEKLGIKSEIEVKDMGMLADRVKDYFKNRSTFIALGSVYKDKPVLVLACTEDLVSSGIDCGSLAGEVGKIIKGGGGGKKDFAQLGGSRRDSLSSALGFAVERVREKLTSG